MQEFQSYNEMAAQSAPEESEIQTDLIDSIEALLKAMTCDPERNPRLMDAVNMATASLARARGEI